MPELIWTLSGDVVRALGPELREHAVVALPFVSERIWGAPSGRFVVALRAGGTELAVKELESDREALVIAAPDPAEQRIVATIAVVEGRELLVCARSGSELEAFALDTGQRMWSVECETFRFAELTPFDHRGVVVAVGFFAGETKESLAVVDLARAASSPDEVFDQFRKKGGVVDYAYRLCAGSAGADAFVVFRDPEDDEEDVEDDADELHGVKGLYIRHVDGAVLARIEWDATSVGALAAGPTWVAVEQPVGIQLVARRAPHGERSVPGRWVACDRRGAYVVVQLDHGLERIDL